MELTKEKKRAFLIPIILSEVNFFNICVLSQCIVYRIQNAQNIHTFTYQKIYFTIFFVCFWNRRKLEMYILLSKLWLIFSSHQKKLQEMSHFWHFIDHDSRSKHDKQTSDPVFSSIFWALSIVMFHDFRMFWPVK